MDTNQGANNLKHDNYTEQFGRLKKALAGGFNLEAVFIEYSILEDRTESILRHAGKWDEYLKNRKDYPVTIETKIKKIQKLAENKKDLLHKYFSDNLLTDVLLWKEKRNRLIHALLKLDLEAGEVADVALKGRELTNAVRNKAGNYIRAVERRKRIA